MAIIIEKIVYPGKSMSRIGGKVLFTDQGLPGEKVEITVIKETKGYTQGQTVKIITPSPHRIIPRCGHYRVCSPYQYIDYSYQVEIKKQQLSEILTRHLKADIPEIVFRESPHAWGYRNKIKLKVLRQDKKPYLAYNLPRSTDRFTAIDKCFLSPETTNSFLNALSPDSLKYLTGLTVRENKKNELLIDAYHDHALDKKTAYKIFEDLFGKFHIAGFMLTDQKDLKKTLVHGDGFLKETIEGFDFHIGTGSFFQVNTEMLSVLMGDMRNELGLSPDNVLADLYCGIGTFGILLSSKVKRVIGVESGKENFHFMKKNIELNNIKNFDTSLCDCKEAISPVLKQRVDIAIIDPPRKGIDTGICNALTMSGPSTLAYISCDPSTLARDLKILLSSYKIKSVHGYDFFPQTPHIETMVILRGS